MPDTRADQRPGQCDERGQVADQDEITLMVLDAVGWSEAYVDTVVRTEDVALGRRAPFMIFRAMERTACVDVPRVLVGGDTGRDVRAGLNAGAGVVVGVRSVGLDDDAPPSTLV